MRIKQLAVSMYNIFLLVMFDGQNNKYRDTQIMVGVFKGTTKLYLKGQLNWVKHWNICYVVRSKALFYAILSNQLNYQMLFAQMFTHQWRVWALVRTVAFFDMGASYFTKVIIIVLAIWSVMNEFQWSLNQRKNAVVIPFFFVWGIHRSVRYFPFNAELWYTLLLGWSQN